MRNWYNFFQLYFLFIFDSSLIISLVIKLQLFEQLLILNPLECNLVLLLKEFLNLIFIDRQLSRLWICAMLIFWNQKDYQNEWISFAVIWIDEGQCITISIYLILVYYILHSNTIMWILKHEGRKQQTNKAFWFRLNKLVRNIDNYRIIFQKLFII